MKTKILTMVVCDADGLVKYSVHKTISIGVTELQRLLSLHMKIVFEMCSRGESVNVVLSLHDLVSVAVQQNLF